MTEKRCKLDPKLRQLHEDDFKGRKLSEIFVDVFVEVANFTAAQWLRKQAGVWHVVHLVDGYYTAKIRADRVAAVADGKGIVVVEAVRFLHAYLDQSIKGINGHIRAPVRSAPYDGHGVVIGIIDYDLDVTLKDFQNPADKRVKDAHNPDGLTRVAFLWNQGVIAKAGEKIPAKYCYGVEYTSKDIDAALQARDYKRIQHNVAFEASLQGHGTHVAGIAAGNGETADDKFRARKYVGVAPAATLVFVSLDRADVVLNAQAPRGTMGNSVNLAHAIAYCFEKAEELGMPCVVNLSLGFNGGGHDGNLAVEWIIDTLLQKPGRAVVFAAGNEHGEDRGVHARLLMSKGDKKALDWRIMRNETKAHELEVWYPRGRRVNVRLAAPDEDASKRVRPGENKGHAFRSGERVRIHSDSATVWGGDARIHILLDKGSRSRGIRRGIWKVWLQLDDAASTPEPMPLDAWIERSVTGSFSLQPQSRLLQYDSKSAITLTTPGTGRGTIVVGSLRNDGNPEAKVAPSSGSGPTRDRRFKPDLTAPGARLYSSNSTLDADGKHVRRRARKRMSGTSMAAPHVAGVIARMLSRNAYLRAEDIQEILIETAVFPRHAKPHPDKKGWSARYGYGTVDATAAVKRVERLTGTRASAPAKKR